MYPINITKLVEMKSHVTLATLLWLFTLPAFGQTEAQLFRQIEAHYSKAQMNQLPFTITSKSEDAVTNWKEHARGQVSKTGRGFQSQSLSWLSSKSVQSQKAETRASALQIYTTPADNVVIILDMNNGNWKMRLQDVQVQEKSTGISFLGKYKNGTSTEVFEIHFPIKDLMTSITN